MSADQGNLYRLRPTKAEPRHPNAWQQQADDPKVSERRMWVVLAFLGVLALVLVAQLVRYQAFGAVPKVDKTNKNTAVDPRLPRGNITDRNGRPLAIEYYTYNIIVDAANIEKPEDIANDLGPLLDQNPNELAQKIRENNQTHYLVVAQEMSPAVVKRIRDKEEKDKREFAITIEARPKRYYPEGSLMCHVLGFVPENRIGYYGVEGYYDDFLRATSTTLHIQAPPKPIEGSRSAAAPLPESPFLPSAVQKDLVLTIDRIIQSTIETELIEAIKEFEAESGTVIVMRPKTGAVLGMASWPDFNPNTYWLTTDESIYLNPAVSRQYEPGSIFKLITFATALENGVITPETKYLDENKFVYYDRTIQNWDKRGRGEVTAQEALAKSLNVTTAKIAIDTKSSAFYKAVTLFGFGQLTNIELEGEVTGLVKSPGKNGWYPVDLATNAFGQGISVTPLQMANAVTAIASDGVLYQPHVVHQVIDGANLRTVESKPIRRAISSETAQTLTEMMVYTVRNTPKAKIPGYAIAGKSGTAEIPDTETGGYTQENTIASFTGFFPADDPQFVILVKLDRPKTSRWATQTAAALFRDIAKDLIDLYAIPPDVIRLGMQPVEEQP